MSEFTIMLFEKYENSLVEYQYFKSMILNFFKNVANLKNVVRQGWVDKLSIDDPESVADHSYSMALIGMVISDMNNYNSEKILKMILLHDLAESEIGDFTPNQLDKEKKKQLENNAFAKIIQDLPKNLQIKYSEIWNEYQEHVSPESKLVHQFDRLEMTLQAKIYQKVGHPKEKLQSFFESAEKDIVDKRLKELFMQIIDDN